MNHNWKKFYNNEFVWTVLTFSFVVTVWELLVNLFKIPQYLLPSPRTIIIEMYQTAGFLWKHSIVTIEVILLGFALSVIAGIFLGIVIAYSPVLEKTLYKLLVATQTIPKVAIAPLLVVWLGLGMAPKVALVFFLCFFPITVNMVSGLQSTSDELLELAEVMGANWLQSFLKIRFPAALPNLFNGLKVSVSLAVIGTIISEFICSDQGLGYGLLIASSQLKGPLTFSIVTILAVIGISLFSMVTRLEKLICPWAKSTEIEGQIISKKNH